MSKDTLQTNEIDNYKRPVLHIEKLRAIAAPIVLESGTDENPIILALEWAAQRPEVQIVNMSAGILGYLPEMREAVTGLMYRGGFSTVR
jgi:hypothetical protein